MGSMFNLDSGFSKFMNRVSDLFLINILWVACSIPTFYDFPLLQFHPVIFVSKTPTWLT